VTTSLAASVRLTVSAEGWLANRLRVSDPEGRQLGSVEFAHWREAATATFDGREYTFTPTREPGRPWTFSSEGTVLARAVKPSAWRSDFELHLGDEVLHLRPRSMWARRFELWRGEERIGEVVPKGWLSHKAYLDVPADWPVPLCAFVYFLVRLIWNRHQAAAVT
jgi:hypothetical protein